MDETVRREDLLSAIIQIRPFNSDGSGGGFWAFLKGTDEPVALSGDEFKALAVPRRTTQGIAPVLVR